jgi:hypothetical protein
LLSLLILQQCVRKVAVHLGYGTYIWLSVSKLPLQYALVSLYSVVKQRLKCNTGNVCICLIQFFTQYGSFNIYSKTFVSAQRLSESTLHQTRSLKTTLFISRCVARDHSTVWQFTQLSVNVCVHSVLANPCIKHELSQKPHTICRGENNKFFIISSPHYFIAIYLSYTRF